MRVYGIVIQHTFGGRLNHNPHLHMMVSAGGLKPAAGEWLKAMEFDKAEIMELWRFAVTSYLWKAHRNGLLQADALPAEFDGMDSGTDATVVERPHHAADVEESLSGVCRAVYPAAAYLAEANPQCDGGGSRLPEQVHSDEDAGRGQMQAGGVCGDAG